MKAHAPHFVLFSETTAAARSNSGGLAAAAEESAPCWHFVLRTEEGSVALDAQDVESDASAERLALWAVVRGLEALPEPSRVTLVTTSGWIRRGLRFGLDTWRDHQWQWECYGRMTPIKNADLWQRVDRALQYHEVDCRTIRLDAPSDDLSRPAPHSVLVRRNGRRTTCGNTSTAQPTLPVPPPSLGRRLREVVHRLCLWCGLCRSDAPAVIAAH